MLVSFFFALKVRLKDLKFEFSQFKLEDGGESQTNLQLTGKNFAQVRLQLKFAFIIRPFKFLHS